MKQKESALSNFSNSGHRILNLVLEVYNKPDQPSQAETWANALGLDANVAKNDPHDVVQYLGILRAEVDLLEKEMILSGFDKSLYHSYVQRVRGSISTKNVGASWNNYKGHLGIDTILALRWCAAVLTPEPQTDFSELENLLSKLQSFREELENSTINGPTYQFVISQINIIESAIKSFPINGGKAIKKAFAEGFADLNAKADDLVKEEDTSITTKVGGFWNDLKTAGSHFVEADRIVNSYIGLINKGNGLAENIVGALNFVS